jgi:hypothetical protein
LEHAAKHLENRGRLSLFVTANQYVSVNGLDVYDNSSEQWYSARGQMDGMADNPLAHVLITHLVRQFGPVRGMQEAKVAFEDTYEKMKPIMERLEAERGEGGPRKEALRNKPSHIGYGDGHVVHRRMQT